MAGSETTDSLTDNPALSPAVAFNDCRRWRRRAPEHPKACSIRDYRAADDGCALVHTLVVTTVVTDVAVSVRARVYACVYVHT